MRGKAACFDELRAFVDGVWLVDCHDHSGECGPKNTDPIQVIASGYFTSDLQSASSDADLAFIQDYEKPLEERWPVFERMWKRACHTGYAQVARRVLKRFYDVDEVSLEALQGMREKLIDFSDEARFDAVLEEAKIAVRLANVWIEPAEVLAGTLKLAPRARLVIPLPQYHGIRSWAAVRDNMKPLNRTVTCLDEYLDGCRALFEGYKAFGAVAFKDQCAYSRTLAFDNPTRADAEAVFNWIMEDPRRSASEPDGIKPLDDYLFHCFMRMARDMDLPVQLHTGHMAGIRNDIVKANAAGLRRLLELHREVRFDLFHANWPYAEDLMYLGKNYPNVAIDFCWANIIDPLYCQNLFKQALSCMPHGKIHGYGSDFGGTPDRAWAHASIARDNIAIALSDMVDIEYLGLDDAKEVAQAWLFDNANAFFRLGL